MYLLAEFSSSMKDKTNILSNLINNLNHNMHHFFSFKLLTPKYLLIIYEASFRTTVDKKKK